MKKIKQIFLSFFIIIIFSLLLIQYTKKAEVSKDVIETFKYNGTFIIFSVMAIITFIIGIKITNLWKEYLLIRFKREKQEIEFKYDFIIVTILCVNMMYRFTTSDTVMHSNQLITTTYSFGIDNNLTLPFLILTGSFIIILRIYIISKFVITFGQGTTVPTEP